MDNDDTTREVIRQVIGQDWTPHPQVKGLMHNPRRYHHRSEDKIPARFRLGKQSRHKSVTEFLGRLCLRLKRSYFSWIGRR